jgi:hypothetical protein
MQHRLLTINDIDQCRTLVLSQCDGKNPVDAEDHWFDDYYFDEANHLYKVYGSFDDTILVAALFVEFSKFDRSYLLRFAVKRPEASIFEFSKLQQLATSYAESIAFYKFTIGYTSHIPAWERLIRDPRYMSFTEEIIPVKTNSSFRLYWEIVQQRMLLPNPVTVRTYLLLEQHRSLYVK